VTWLLGEGTLPVSLSARAIVATIYLGVIASAFGFALYYYILNRMDVGRVALITLITPICALVLGNLLNHEALSPGVLSGTGFIVAGLLLYEYGRKLYAGIFS
jgi:drug/metabolite transporter (DMT)-like permease